jgi:hypothetical protein
MMQYLIDDEMLMQWRSGCVIPATMYANKCKMCRFGGESERENCCEFDDNEMQKIFQSVRYIR